MRGVLSEKSPSTHFNVQVLHNAAPICHLISDESIEIVCAVLVRLYVELRVTRAHLRRSERLVETGIELVHDRFRSAVADKDAVPVQRLKTWKTPVPAGVATWIARRWRAQRAARRQRSKPGSAVRPLNRPTTFVVSCQP